MSHNYLLAFLLKPFWRLQSQVYVSSVEELFDFFVYHVLGALTKRLVRTSKPDIRHPRKEK